MSCYVGLDVSVENTAICVIDGAGEIVGELSAPSHPDDLAAALVPFAGDIEAIGLEAGPMSVFLVEGLKTFGLTAIVITSYSIHYTKLYDAGLVGDVPFTVYHFE